MRRSGKSFVSRLACGVAVVLLAAPVVGVGAGASSGVAGLVLRAPARVAVGRLVRLRVTVTGAPALGALQANLRFDDHALEVARVVVEPRFAGTGAVTPLSAVETPNRKLIAAYSCVAPACPAGAGVTVDGSTVVSVDVLVLHAGRIEVRLDGGLLVGRDGAVIGRPAASRVVLDAGGSSRVWGAPVGPVLSARGHGRGDSPDLSGDGRVTAADAQGMERSFVRGAEDDVACAAPEAGTDVDGDGCVTIADLQRASASATTFATSERGRAAGDVHGELHG